MRCKVILTFQNNSNQFLCKTNLLCSKFLRIGYSGLHGLKACRMSILDHGTRCPSGWRYKPFGWQFRPRNAVLSSKNAFFHKLHWGLHDCFQTANTTHAIYHGINNYHHKCWNISINFTKFEAKLNIGSLYDAHSCTNHTADSITLFSLHQPNERM